ncbi:hypothetical protein [Streptomyces sp. NPDC057616]|uniref:hypothetical protein n=1 Tax=Streptomyces sp. NPDC057616 TaxID=3346183 RepID=UPI003680D308
MSEAEDRPESPERAPDTSPAGPPEDVAADRDAWAPAGLPGQPLTTLVFRCDAHGEEQVVDYYDPLAPPRCSHGDPMVRSAG